MGERLAKDIQAIFEAKIEQLPLWHKAMAADGLTYAEAPEYLLAVTSVLRETILYLAREVDDPPGTDDTQP